MKRAWIGAFCVGTCGGTSVEGSFGAKVLAMVQCPSCHRVLAAVGDEKAMLAPGVEGLILDADAPTDSSVWTMWQGRVRELTRAARRS